MPLVSLTSVLFFLIGASSNLWAAKAPPSPWALLAAEDLKMMHTVMKEDHPGTLDDNNPGFRRWLEEGYQAALKRAETVSSFEGYVFTIYAYGYGFRDPSVHISFSVRTDNYRWPGFLVTLQGGQYVVHVPNGLKNSAQVPQEGDLLDSCDGHSPKELIERKIFPFFGNSDWESGWSWAASHLFIDGGNPFVERFKNCIFKRGKETRLLSLEWVRIRKSVLFDQIELATLPAEQQLGIREFKKGFFWITLPTFSDVGADQEGSRIFARVPQLRNVKAVVLDTRGNHGGEIQWASQLLEALYGKDFLNETSPPPTILDWRVSQRNYEKHMEFLELMRKELGTDSRFFVALNSALEGFAEALKRGQPFYRQTRGTGVTHKGQTSANHSTVYLLTDGACVGACLGFADRVLGTKQAIQIGLPTDADWPYVASREQLLPSGAVSLSISTKFIRNRRRGNVPYNPRYRWDKDIRDTRALEKWVIGLRSEEP